jgi:hypothetical protein
MFFQAKHLAFCGANNMFISITPLHVLQGNLQTHPPRRCLFRFGQKHPWVVPLIVAHPKFSRLIDV